MQPVIQYVDSTLGYFALLKYLGGVYRVERNLCPLLSQMRNVCIGWCFALLPTSLLSRCMPAFANFVKLLSTKISSMRSRSRSHGSNKDSCEAWETPPPLSRTDGITAIPAQKSPREYRDLTDTMLLQTQVSIAGGGRLPMQYTEHYREPLIVRTMGIYQQESRREEHTQSVEQLLQAMEAQGICVFALLDRNLACRTAIFTCDTTVLARFPSIVFGRI